MKKSLAPLASLESRIYTLRGQRVMLSTHLAPLYGVPVKVLNQAVKRSRDRFPDDFMFQLTPEEFDHLKSQFVTSSWGGLRRARPYAFTEQGVAMLSAVLNSPRAVQVSIEIMRAFIRLRRLLITVEDLAGKVEKLEQKALAHDADLHDVFRALKQLMAPPRKPRREIGFHAKP